MFANRGEAGELVAEKLLRYKDAEPVILALPRGGVVIGEKVANALNAPLDVLVVRKVGHPHSPEFAIGAVDENGTLLLDDADANPHEVDEVIEREQQESKRRSSLYRRGRPPLNVKGKTVILVDDGIATGRTMKLSVMIVKDLGAKEIIVAVPVAAPEAVAQLKNDGIEVVVLEPPEDFRHSVGAHYIEFPQTSDEEVIGILRTISQ